MGKNYVYLGKKVRDTGEPGYDSSREGKAIAREILEDYKKHRISKRKATSRLNLLELVTQKNSKLTKKEKKEVRNYIDEKIRPKLSGEKKKKKSKKSKSRKRSKRSSRKKRKGKKKAKKSNKSKKPKKKRKRKSRKKRRSTIFWLF